MAKRASSKTTDTPARRLLRRVAVVVAVVAVGVYLVEGGEWGTLDLLAQRQRFDKLQAEVKRLEKSVDSLRAEYKDVTTNDVRLERVAREKYGMVRGNKELLYQLRRNGDVDSAVRDSSEDK